MITIRKLKTLRESNALKKISILLEEQINSNQTHYSSAYIKQIIDFIISCKLDSPTLKNRARSLQNQFPNYSLDQLRSFQTFILKEFEFSQSHLDQVIPSDLTINRTPPLQFINEKLVISDIKKELKLLFLEDLRSPYNMGAIFRSAEAFGIHQIILSQDCPRIDHPRTLRTAMGTLALVPHIRINYDQKETFLSQCCRYFQVFALECGRAESIDLFDFPKQALFILGSEELGVSSASIKIARTSGGVISIPMSGTKGSINVSTAAGILMHRWLSNPLDKRS